MTAFRYHRFPPTVRATKSMSQKYRALRVSKTCSHGWSSKSIVLCVISLLLRKLLTTVLTSSTKTVDTLLPSLISPVTAVLSKKSYEPYQKTTFTTREGSSIPSSIGVDSEKSQHKWCVLCREEERSAMFTSMNCHISFSLKSTGEGRLKCMLAIPRSIEQWSDSPSGDNSNLPSCWSRWFPSS